MGAGDGMGMGAGDEMGWRLGWYGVNLGEGRGNPAPTVRSQSMGGYDAMRTGGGLRSLSGADGAFL
jgi:hypothetical protein